MPKANNTYLPYLVLAILSIPLFFLNICELHSWGDDFSQYIKEAQNIATGRPYYESNYMFNPYNPAYAPPQYPPGFPLMLAPIIKIWGLSFKAMGYYTAVLVVALMFSLYAFFRKHTGTVAAICLAVALSYSNEILDLKRFVLADIPCLIFITLYLAVRVSDTFSWRRIALLVLLAVCAAQVRSQAIFLVAAEGIYALYMLAADYLKNKKANWKAVQPYLAIVAGVMIVNFILNELVFATPHSTTVFYNNFIKNAMGAGKRRTFIEYLGYSINTAKGYFHYDSYQALVKAFGTIVEDAGLTLCILGLALRLRKGLQMEDIFVAIMAGLIIFYPVRDPRYFLPAAPVLYLYCYTALRALLPLLTTWDKRLMAAGLTLFYLCSGWTTFVAAVHPDLKGTIPQQNDKQAFEYIKEHVGTNDIIVFTKPRALTLFTNKKSINMSWQTLPIENKHYFDSLQVKYMLIVDGLDDQYFKDYLDKTQHPISSVRIADKYTLYTLR
jgi:hypothetical protein